MRKIRLLRSFSLLSSCSLDNPFLQPDNDLRITIRGGPFMRRARMKKVLSAVLIAALLCFVLSSCRMPGNDPNGGPSVIKGLSVTDCTLTIEEATGLVETSLLLHNDSGTTCNGLYALPLISGGMKEGSFSVSASAGAALTGGTDLSLSVPAHSDLSVSYRYTAAGSLVLSARSASIFLDFCRTRTPRSAASVCLFCLKKQISLL